MRHKAIKLLAEVLKCFWAFACSSPPFLDQFLFAESTRNRFLSTKCWAFRRFLGSALVCMLMRSLHRVLLLHSTHSMVQCFSCPIQCFDMEAHHRVKTRKQKMLLVYGATVPEIPNLVLIIGHGICNNSDSWARWPLFSLVNLVALLAPKQ